MTALEVFIMYDDENDDNGNACNGAVPFDAGCGGTDHHLFMCYYTSR